MKAEEKQLGEAARAIFDALPGPRDPNAYMFPKNDERESPSRLLKNSLALVELA